MFEGNLNKLLYIDFNIFNNMSDQIPHHYDILKILNVQKNNYSINIKHFNHNMFVT